MNRVMIVVTLVFLDSSVLSPISDGAKKPLLSTPRSSPKKISEHEIIEIGENVCNLKKEEADWMLKIDIVKKGDKFQLVEQTEEQEAVTAAFLEDEERFMGMKNKPGLRWVQIRRLFSPLVQTGIKEQQTNSGMRMNKLQKIKLVEMRSLLGVQEVMKLELKGDIVGISST